MKTRRNSSVCSFRKRTRVPDSLPPSAYAPTRARWEVLMGSLKVAHDEMGAGRFGNSTFIPRRCRSVEQLARQVPNRLVCLCPLWELLPCFLREGVEEFQSSSPAVGKLSQEHLSLGSFPSLLEHRRSHRSPFSPFQTSNISNVSIFSIRSIPPALNAAIPSILPAGDNLQSFSRYKSSGAGKEVTCPPFLVQS